MSLIGVSQSSFSWAFAHMENNEPMPHFQIIFDLLRHWGLWFNWNMQNAFTFDFANWGEKICCKVKMTFLWQLIVLEKSWNLNYKERANFAMSHVIILDI